MAVQIQLRNDTAANWTSSNPTLAAGEMGVETDTAKYKIGTGSTAWTSLAYGGVNAGTFSAAKLIAVTEKWNIVGSAFATGTNNIDVSTASVWYYNSNATASGTINFRSNSGATLSSLLSVGDSITVVAIIQNGTTAYYPASYTIDGASVTPKWQTGTAPAAGSVSANDVYTYTITKTTSAPAYVVFAAQTKFGA